ncbi:larval cuticle protein LCP-17-like protein [Corchorus capsularis]|uniref:Larval cuticle protein LCP-17-like protein n=1 Tax=Corchorus capsularis TaxID=210143 RepID=A0A1R3GLB1_COCAP|nr:larval cuticle protein LCP-17-like protein [Corchorus capsularis]
MEARCGPSPSPKSNSSQSIVMIFGPSSFKVVGPIVMVFGPRPGPKGRLSPCPVNEFLVQSLSVVATHPEGDL